MLVPRRISLDDCTDYLPTHPALTNPRRGVELSAEDRDAQFRFELDLLLRSTAVGAWIACDVLWTAQAKSPLVSGVTRRDRPHCLAIKASLSLAKTSSDSLMSTEIRQSVHRPKTPSLVGGRATGIVRPSALHGHTGVAMQNGERAGRAAELAL